MDTNAVQATEQSDGRRAYVEPELIAEGQLEELTMIPTFLLEAYG